MGYFSKDWTTYIEVDAGPVGLGCTLWQRNPSNPHKTKIIKFDSCLLSDTEQRYSQCEKEGLAAVWACEKNEVYLIGQSFYIITDNKGIELIFKNSNSKPPPRLHRMLLRLSPFDFTIIHRPGKSNISDCLSRHPIDQPPTKLTNLVDTHLQHTINSITPNAIKLEEIQSETKADPSLQKLIKLIMIGKRSKDRQLAPYMKIFNDLTLDPSGTIILKNQKILIPFSIHRKVIELAHHGHQGLVKTKKLLRSKVWFPGIDRTTESRIKNCQPCTINAPKSHPEPLQPTPMPEPWQTVALDHKGPLNNGKHALVMIDLGSRYAIIHEVKSTSFENNSACLTQTWTLFGPPKEVLTDNGPPFSGQNFKTHLNHFGINHRKITPA